MSDNIVKFPTHQPAAKPAKRRSYGTGVTILFNGTGLLAGPQMKPEDAMMAQNMYQAHKDWVAEGRPINACNLGPGPGAA